ncbi:MAG TPA: hypothetical protein VFB63_03270 [Bryobacteraceae bacterium]|jgi:hypothetical protein|nr:hypothetical protein [Bryobacteraceae bacterium]
MDDASRPEPDSPTAAAPVLDEPLRVARYRALHERRRECGQRAWITGLVLVPSAFASLAGLTRITCPAAMDFIILSGISILLLTMWMLLADRFRQQEEEALHSIAEMEGADGAPGHLGRGRFGRLLVACALLGLFVTAWYIRPPCETDTPIEDPELTRRL